jgi:hypothetical protein
MIFPEALVTAPLHPFSSGHAAPLGVGVGDGNGTMNVLKSSNVVKADVEAELKASNVVRADVEAGDGMPGMGNSAHVPFSGSRTKTSVSLFAVS